MPGIGIAVSPVIVRLKISTAPPPFGTIFNYSSFPNLNDFSNSSGNFSTGGSQTIIAAKSGWTFFSSRLIYNKNGYKSNLEIFDETVIYNVGSRNGFGLGMGTGGGNPMCAMMFCDTFPGRIKIFDATSEAELAASATDLVIANNDRIRFTVVDEKGTITATAENLTNPTVSVSCQYTYSLYFPIAANGGTQPVNHAPALYAVGGTQEIESWSANSNALVGAKWGVVSDSLGAGFFAETTGQRWLEVCADGETSTIYSAPGATTTTMLECSDQLGMMYGPGSTVFLSLWVNGLLNNVAHSTIISEGKLLVSLIQGNGATVILCDCTPIQGVTPKDAAAFNVDLRADPILGPLVLVDSYDIARDGAAANTWGVGLSPDGLHGGVDFNNTNGVAARMAA
jgi:hypothetical protein